MRIILIAIVLAFNLVTIDAYAESSKYLCPMHPHIHGKEGDTCPICGMNLVPFEQEQSHDMKGMQSGDHSEHSQHAVTLSKGMIQTIGVKTAKVKKEDFGGIVRTFANIVRNERAERKVTSRADGWIDELGASAAGDDVEKGSLLYKIHSPDIVIAQGDYIRDLKTGNATRDIASYKVFHHYEVDESVIKKIAKTKIPLQSVPYYASAKGTVTEIHARKGSYVTLNSVIATMQDFSTVWAHVDVAEKDLSFITKETPAKVFVPTNGDRMFEAIVDYIHPTINPETRTGLVRLVIDNKDGKLRPGAYIDVEFMTAPDMRLTVPSEAILKASDGDRVIVALGEGKFTPVTIKAGVTRKGKTEVLEGLKSGDEVVTSSQFLIDSESSLREALSKFSSNDTNAGGAHAGH